MFKFQYKLIKIKWRPDEEDLHSTNRISIKTPDKYFPKPLPRSRAPLLNSSTTKWKLIQASKPNSTKKPSSSKINNPPIPKRSKPSRKNPEGIREKPNLRIFRNSHEYSHTIKCTESKSLKEKQHTSLLR